MTIRNHAIAAFALAVLAAEPAAANCRNDYACNSNRYNRSQPGPSAYERLEINRELERQRREREELRRMELERRRNNAYGTRQF